MHTDEKRFTLIHRDTQIHIDTLRYTQIRANIQIYTRINTDEYRYT